MTVRERDPRIDAALEIIEREVRAVSELRERIGPSFAAVVDATLACEGRVVTTGMGKAGFIAQKISATLASTGTPSIFLHPAEALHGDLGRVTEDDIVLCLSKSGETEEVLRLLPALRVSRVRVVSITESAESTLGQNSDLVLELGPIAEADAHDLAPTASTLAMLAMGDALALVVQDGRDFGLEEFARFHPAGELGRRLMKVSEVMRTGERNPLVDPTGTVRETIVTMTRTVGRPGAAIIVDDEHMLLGYFTDGDLRRHLEQATERLLDLPISEVMTAKPTTIGSDRLAAEALGLMLGHKWDNMPVVDDTGRVVGLIDLQDVQVLGFTV